MSSLMGDLVADHILQVNLVHRKGSSNMLGSINLWKKGGWFGKADELLKFCAGPGCSAVFNDSFTLSEKEAMELGNVAGDVSKWPPHMRHKYYTWYDAIVMCPACGISTTRENLPDSYGFNMTADRIATRMAHFFNVLGRTADVFLVRTKEHNTFQKAREELYSANRSFSRYQRMLDQSRDRESVLYPLKRIIKETADSGSPEDRFKAMIKA